MKRFWVFIVLVWVMCFALASDMLEKDITYLASKECNGRNLAENGIFKAESYIVEELEKVGLIAQIQSVDYKLNQTLETPVCVIDGDTLETGYDYIPHPFSSACDKIFSKDEIVIMDSAALASVKEKHDLYSNSSARRYVLKKSKRKDKNSLMVFLGDKPIISNQSKQSKRPAIQINKEKMPAILNEIYLSNQVELKKVSTNNVIAVVKGSEKPDSAICLSAHYDHMGALGEVYYPGANDNASGVAVLLSLARHYAKNPPPITLVFCFFTGEEQGLLGSKAYVKDPSFPLENILMVINLDMVGSGLNGYGVVAGNNYPEDVSIFEDIREKYDMGDLRLRDNSPNSDHFPFTRKGVPAMFFYASGGEQPYHYPEDIPETLDWKAMENTVLLMKEYITKNTGR